MSWFIFQFLFGIASGWMAYDVVYRNSTSRALMFGVFMFVFAFCTAKSLAQPDRAAGIGGDDETGR
jgi:uncharacterized membrane protein (DUF485 family)